MCMSEELQKRRDHIAKGGTPSNYDRSHYTDEEAD
jgi:hypothetical protein